MTSATPSGDNRLQDPPLRQVLKALLVVGAVGGVVVASWWAWVRPQAKPAASRQSGPVAGAPSTEVAVEWRVQPEFVGSQACRKCHPDQFESYLETPHSRALAEVVAADEPADAVFDDPATGRRYRTTRWDGELIHEVSLLLDDGTESLQTRLPVRYRFGSGHFGRGYLVATDGFLVESPISWFESRQAWALSPGFEGPNRMPFGRTVPEGCLFCHSGHVERSTLSDLRMRIIEPSIGCERCHGPGKVHVEQESAAAGERAAAQRAIVNPRRLSRKLSEAICHQCHLQGDIRVPGRDVHAEGFRAGEALEKYRQEYLIRKPRTAMQVVGHVGQLARSACYKNSDTLSCVTCHDPHAATAPEDRADHYRTVCLSCHQDEQCRLGLPQRMQERQNDCAACHMPSRATEMPHVAFTHHQIGKHPLEDETPPADSADRLVPLFDSAALSEPDRRRSLGLAWQELLISPKAGRMTRSEMLQIGRRAEQILTTLPAEF
ncbi:MAG: cytochrome c3 family protein, partial [Deltaproteobacteria bacterium]